MTRFKLFILVSAVGFSFICTIYNFDLALNALLQLFDRFTLIYIAITFFFLYLFRFLKKRTNESNLIIGLYCIICPIAVDASVLITAPNFVPHRFPFASLFPILGCTLGYFSLQQKKTYIIGLLLLLPFFYITDQYIIPKMLFYEFERDSKKIADNLYHTSFYTTTGEAIELQDTIKSKYAILECFFKGCAPCEEKRLALNLLSDTISHEKLSIVYICDGKWTSQKDFREYAEKNSYKNAIYLYDGNGFLKSKLKINGYPFEILLKDGKVISTFSGFSEMIQKNYFKKQFELIK
jgi:hypothetical protein